MYSKSMEDDWSAKAGSKKQRFGACSQMFFSLHYNRKSKKIETIH